MSGILKEAKVDILGRDEENVRRGVVAVAVLVNAYVRVVFLQTVPNILYQVVQCDLLGCGCSRARISGLVCGRQSSCAMSY